MLRLRATPLVSRLCLLAIIGLTGCDTFDDVPVPPSSPAFPYSSMAPMAPPAPREEMPLASNNPQAEIWRPGYWDYENGVYSWVPGYLMPRPDPTAVWSPDHWVLHNYGWAFVAGSWQ